MPSLRHIITSYLLCLALAGWLGCGGSGSDNASETPVYRQTAKIVPSDGAAGDFFGTSLDADEDYLIVGSPRKDINGINGGGAYIFKRDPASPTGWTEVAILSPPDLTEGSFGSAVGISGDTAVVGAPGIKGATEMVGAAYIFQRNQNSPDSWGIVAKLVPPGDGHFDKFGADVAIDGDNVLVGAPSENFDSLFGHSGHAYIFGRNKGGDDVWALVAELISSGSTVFDQFGHSVSLSGDYAFVGAAPYLMAGPRNPGDRGGYIFYRLTGGESGWGQLIKLPAPRSGYEHPLSMDGSRAIIGNPWLAGEALIFNRSLGGIEFWGLEAELLGPDSVPEDLVDGIGDRFGSRVCIAGKNVAITASAEGSGAIISGAVYFFFLDGSSWRPVYKFVPADAEDGDRVGASLALEGNRAFVGAPFNNSLGENAGSVYVIER